MYNQAAGIFCISLCEEIPTKQKRNIDKPVQSQASKYVRTRLNMILKQNRKTKKK